MTAYFSEIAITGDSPQEFIELAVTAGTDTSGYSVVHYMGSGTILRTYDFGTVVQTIDGKDVYTIDDSDPDVPVVLEQDDPMGNIYPDDAFALVDDTGTVIQFVSFYDNNITATEGPANGMTSTMIGTPGAGQSLETYDEGSSYSNQSSPNRNSIPCFAIDTDILTEDGYRNVATLRIGHRVMTADHGLQKIRWIQRFREDLSHAPRTKKPVHIMANSLGPDLPKHDLTVSPQHRIVISGTQQLRAIGPNEMLAPAKGLTSLPGISHIASSSEMIWTHFAFDRHEVIYANGAAVETLLLSDHILSGLPQFQRKGLHACAARHKRQLGKTRQILTVSQAQRIVHGAVMAPA